MEIVYRENENGKGERCVSLYVGPVFTYALVCVYCIANIVCIVLQLFEYCAATRLSTVLKWSPEEEPSYPHLPHYYIPLAS